MTNRKSSRAFQRAIGGVCTLSLSPLKFGWKTDFSIFWDTIQFHK